MKLKKLLKTLDDVTYFSVVRAYNAATREIEKQIFMTKKNYSYTLYEQFGDSTVLKIEPKNVNGKNVLEIDIG